MVCVNNRTNNNPVLVFLLIYFAALLQRLMQFVQHDFQRSEMYSNWLINYRGGFIRRGLGGSIILQLSSVFGISTTLLTNIICAAAWIFIIVFFTVKFIKKKYPIFILALPFFIGETILIDPSCFLRKDSFCLMMFIIILSLFFNNKSKSLFLFFKINLLFVFGILIHEVIFFFSFPILFLSYHKKYGSWIQSLLFFVPSIVAFSCCELISSDEKAREMLRLTPQINVDYVGFLFTPFFKSFAMLWSQINDPHLLFTLFYFLLWIVSVYFVSVNFDKLKIDLSKKIETNSGFLSRILIFQFLSISPLFFCTWDWGRWMFLWVGSSFAYFLTADVDPFDRKIFDKLDFSRFGFFQKISQQPWFVFTVAILINCQYMLPLEKNFFIHTPVFEVLNMISKAIYFVKYMF